jgi:hypothetical protein
MEGTERRGGGCKQQPNGLKKTITIREFKYVARDGTLWRTRFGRGYGPAVREDYGMKMMLIVMMIMMMIVFSIT